MTKPEPVPGLVIRYDYLWRDEEQRGRRGGEKDRPCAIVIARKMPPDGDTTLVLAAITHTPTRTPDDGIEIPEAVKRHLGLDEARSWIVTSEVNAVPWTDAGIVPASPTRWAYGTLPPKLMQRLLDHVIARFGAGILNVVERSGL